MESRKPNTVAVILHSKGKLWMSQRIHTETFHGLWQFPGGKCEDLENPRDAAVREVKEETNLEINLNRIQYVTCIKDDPTTAGCFVYETNLHEHEIPFRTENKMTDWVLLSREEALLKDLMPGLKKIISGIK